MIAAQTPKKRRPKPAFVAAVIVVLLVLIGAAGAGAFILFSDELSSFWNRNTEENEITALTAAYASDDAVTVSSQTTILPQDLEDEALNAYTARVKEADDLDGAALDISQIPRLSIEGTGGFSLGNFGQLEDGTYLVCLETDAGESFDLPPLVIDSSDTANTPEELTVTAPTDATGDTSLARVGKYASFRDTLATLIETYGDASLSVMQIQEGRYLAWIAGVTYADIVDFGDGTERLVVAYCTNSDLASSDTLETTDDIEGNYGPSTDDYLIEIWEYNAESDAAELALRLSSVVDDSDWPSIRFVENPITDGVALVATSENASSNTISCYGINDSGAFGRLSVSDSDIERLGTQEAYLIAHLGVTQEDALDDSSSNEVSCEETAQTVKDLTSQLNLLSGD